jgi:hypothetical protein
VDFDISATCPVRSQSRIGFASHPARRTRSRGGVTMVSWEQEQEFFDPIVLQGRTPLPTLRDAAHYITKLPKAERDAEEWQAGMQALLLVAQQGEPAMFARIGVMKH